MLEKTLFALYRKILPSGIFLLKLFRFLLPPKIQQMFADRKDQRFQPLDSAPIWIHAASGEIEYAKPVIRTLKARYPHLKILVTYFSPSAVKLIRTTDTIDLFMPLPWDTPKNAKAFFDFYKPRAALFARTDVWPCYATELSARQIPSLLFSATLAENSSKLKTLSGALSRLALKQLTNIQCVSEKDKNNFEKIHLTKSVQVCGDTRFDQVFHRLLVERRELRHPTFPPREKVLVCGSTWPQDEMVIFDTLQICKSVRPKILLAPHETNEAHLTEIEVELAKRELSCARFSQVQAWDKQDILIVDQVGALQELYNLGHVAFVGGSFKDKVHSVMEPLGAGLPVIVGPHHLNNREALAYRSVALQDLKFVNPIEFAKDFRNLIETFFKMELDHTAIQKSVASSTGASQRVLDWVEQSLQS